LKPRSITTDLLAVESYATGSVHTLCQETITRFKNDNSSYRKSGIQRQQQQWNDLLELFYLAFYISRYRRILIFISYHE
jgi:hypothetical protein